MADTFIIYLSNSETCQRSNLDKVSRNIPKNGFCHLRRVLILWMVVHENVRVSELIWPVWIPYWPSPYGHALSHVETKIAWAVPICFTLPACRIAKRRLSLLDIWRQRRLWSVVLSCMRFDRLKIVIKHRRSPIQACNQNDWKMYMRLHNANVQWYVSDDPWNGQNPLENSAWWAGLWQKKKVLGTDIRVDVNHRYNITRFYCIFRRTR